jgi:hypothetical protein
MNGIGLHFLKRLRLAFVLQSRKNRTIGGCQQYRKAPLEGQHKGSKHFCFYLPFTILASADRFRGGSLQSLGKCHFWRPETRNFNHRWVVHAALKPGKIVVF